MRSTHSLSRSINLLSQWPLSAIQPPVAFTEWYVSRLIENYPNYFNLFVAQYVSLLRIFFGGIR